MKISFSPSPPPPPSSSSTSYVSSSSLTSSLDRNLNNNSENVTTKCFSSIIRRFLCSGNLRTHPFDSSNKQVDRVVVEFDHQKDLKAEEKKIQAPATPGLVARLMGLDSMPSKGSSTHPDSIGRSRSVNSMDCRLESYHKIHGGHRRVKTSLSFRERPTFLELENDEFLLLSFENVSESKEFGGSKGRRKVQCEMGCDELKHKKENGSENRGSRGGEQRVFDQNKDDHKRSNKRNCCAKYKQQHERKIFSKPRRKDVQNNLDSASPGVKKRNPKDRLNRMKHKEVSDGSKSAGKKKNNRPALKKVEPECKLENSSPVSVLDIDDFEFEQGSNSSEDESRRRGLNLTRKPTPEDAVLKNSDRPSIHFTRISISEVPELTTVERQSSTESTKKIDIHTEDYIQLWGEVCKLTEEDMKTSNWMPREMLKREELEEIGTGFGLEILNQLLHEMAGELEELPNTMSTNFSL